MSKLTLNDNIEIVDFLKSKIDSVISALPIELTLKIQEENIIYPGSPIESSTAFGYIIESYISQLLCSKYPQNFSRSTNDNILGTTNVTNSSYDLKFNANNRNILVNIKVENPTSKNNAVAAFEQYLSDMSKEDISTVFYILKFSYKLNVEKGTIIISKFEIYNIDVAFLGNVKADNRQWNDLFKNKPAGRMQVKTTKIKNDIDLREINIKYIQKVESYIADFKEQLNVIELKLRTTPQEGVVKKMEVAVKKLNSAIETFECIKKNFENR